MGSLRSRPLHLMTANVDTVGNLALRSGSYLDDPMRAGVPANCGCTQRLHDESLRDPQAFPKLR
jgi:hypothetical protein